MPLLSLLFPFKDTRSHTQHSRAGFDFEKEQKPPLATPMTSTQHSCVYASVFID